MNTITTRNLRRPTFLSSVFRAPSLPARSVLLPALLMMLCLSACSRGFFFSEPTAEVKVLLVNVATRHIGLIVLGDATAVAASVFPDEYFGKGGARITPGEFASEIAALKKLYPATPAAHPLLGLRVNTVKQSENDAYVDLSKDPKMLPAGESNPTIRLQMIWTGSAWIVATDSLFGSGGLIPQLIARHQTAG